MTKKRNGNNALIDVTWRGRQLYQSLLSLSSPPTVMFVNVATALSL